MSLADLPVGGTGRVVSVHTGGPLGKRLQHLGLVPGTRVTKLRRGPLGDPAAYSFRGTVLALRNRDAAKVCVDVLPAAHEIRATFPARAKGSKVVS